MTGSSVSSRVGRVAVLCLSDPDAARQGGTMRTRSLIEGLRAGGVTVEPFFPATLPGGSGTSSSTTSLASGLKHSMFAVKRHYLPMATGFAGRDPQLRARLAAFAPDLVVVCSMSLFSAAVASGAPVWMDYLDLWSDFARREAAVRHGLARLSTWAQQNVLLRQEAAMARHAVLVTAVGWRDAERLRERGLHVQWLPTALDDAEFRRSEAPSTFTAGYLADFDYAPNRDAFAVLAQHWLPGMRERGWELVIAGRSSERWVTPTPGLRVLGTLPARAEALTGFYDQVQATLAPIRIGGGMKVKVLESLSRGVPVIASPHAAEGLPPEVTSLLRITDPQRPDLSLLDEAYVSGRLDPTIAELVPFRQSDIRRRIQQLLSQLTLAFPPAVTRQITLPTGSPSVTANPVRAS